MKTKAVVGFLLVAVAVSNRSSGQTTRPTRDKLTPAAPGSVQFTGRLGEKLSACMVNGLLAQDFEKFVVPFREKREVGGADWRCEYWGKWFTGLSLADAYKPTAESAGIRDKAAAELLATAAPDGYIGTRQPKDRTQGWDTWGCKYALLGVLAEYDRTGNPADLQAAKRQGDVLIDEFGPGKTNIEDAGEWNGLPASSVLEPVVQLYERTGETKYLDFANHIVASWRQPSKRLKRGMRLVDDSLTGLRPSYLCAPKAYEMMSCFEGLCELYRADGNRQFLDASVALAGSIHKHEVSLIGVGTSNEVWFEGAKKQTGVIPKPMETCVTATWMKLNYQLLRLTGDSKYADELERNLYNGLLGAMMPRGNWWAYFSSQMGVRVPSYVQHDDVGTSCCVLNGPRGLMITPSWAFMNGVDGPVLNLYAPASVKSASPTGQAVDLVITGDYPVGDRAEITVRPEHAEEFTLTLRVPNWSTRTDVKVNGEAVAVEPGTYAKVRRKWAPGDRVSIGFDMRCRVVDAPDANGQIALVRGPIVLSLDDRLTPAAVGAATLSRTDAATVEITPNPAAAAKVNAWMAFDVNFVVDGKPTPLTFCDYADAGNAFSRQNHYRTWLPQPLDLQAVYKTGQTWQTLSHANHWTEGPK